MGNNEQNDLSNNVGIQIAAGCASFGYRGLKFTSELLVKGIALAGYYGVYKPGRWVWDQTVQPKIDEMMERREAERQEREAERLRQEEILEEQRILAGRDHERELQQFKDRMRVRKILSVGSEKYGRGLIEKALCEKFDRQDLSDFTRVLDENVVAQRCADGRIIYRCVCCGQFASRSEGCDSCREGWGPPRISPEEMVGILREKWSDSVDWVSLEELLLEYQRGVHSVREPIRIYPGLGSRPSDVSEEDWRNMSDQEREEKVKAICIWDNGFVGISNRSYKNLEFGWREGGHKMWTIPWEFSDTGHRVLRKTPAFGRGWVGDEDILVGRVTTDQDRVEGSRGKKITDYKPTTWKEWRKDSGLFESSIVWAFGDVPEEKMCSEEIENTPNDRKKKHRSSKSPEREEQRRETISLGEFKDLASNSTENNTCSYAVSERNEVDGDVGTGFWEALDRHDAAEKIIEGIGIDTIQNARIRLGSTICEGDAICPLCKNSGDIGGGCVSCTEKGMMPPVISEFDIADFLIAMDENGNHLTRDQGINLAKELYGKLHEPMHYLCLRDGTGTSYWAVYDNGAVYEVNRFTGDTPDYDQLRPIVVNTSDVEYGRLVLISFYADDELRFYARAVDMEALEIISVSEGKEDQGLTLDELRYCIGQDGAEIEEIKILFPAVCAGSTLPDRFRQGLWGKIHVPHNRYLTNPKERIRTIVEKTLINVRSREYWSVKPGIRIDGDGRPHCLFCNGCFDAWSGCLCNKEGSGPIRVTAELIVNTGKLITEWRSIPEEDRVHSLMENTIGDIVPPHYVLRKIIGEVDQMGENYIFIWGNGYVSSGNNPNDWRDYSRSKPLSDIRIFPIGTRSHRVRYTRGSNSQNTGFIEEVANSLGYEVLNVAD